jgi:hypothetical protein
MYGPRRSCERDPVVDQSMKEPLQSVATHYSAPARARPDATRAATTAVLRPPTSIRTRMKFAASSERVWRAILFYEQIGALPPLHLRLLLPVPIGTDSAKSNVGDEIRCLYKGGHLLKRLTRIDVGRHYGFEVVEQNLAVGGGLVLCGGCYTLRELPEGGTEVAATTRYTSPRRPGWLWKPIEVAVCHMFHRYLLDAMRRKVDADCAATASSRDT